MNHAPTRIVQSVFSLVSNIPKLIVKVCIVWSDRIDYNGVECTFCKDTYPWSTYYNILLSLQVIIRLEAFGNAQNANMLVLVQEVAVDFLT